MLEYVFFDETLRNRFAEFSRQNGIEPELAEDELLVALPEEIDPALGDAVDEFYEKLLQENAQLLEGTEDALEKNVAGVRVQLSDGTPCMIRLDPEVMSRVLNCISLDELRDMVQAIAASVEDPDDRPLCHT